MDEEERAVCWNGQERLHWGGEVWVGFWDTDGARGREELGMLVWDAKGQH